MDTSELSGPTLKALATGLRRSSSRQRTSVRRTAASGSSSWPTAQAMTAGEKLENNMPDNSPLHRAAAMWPTARQEDAESAGNHPAAVDSLTGAAGLWRTPAGQEPGISGERLDGGDGHRAYDKTTGRLAQYGITQQAEMWSTPQEDDANNAYGRVTGAQKGLARDAVNNWPTPAAVEMPNSNANQKNMPPSLHGAAEAWQTPKSPDGGNTSRGHDRKGEPLLDGQARSWASPKSRDWKGGQGAKPRQSPDLDKMAESRSFLPHPTTLTDGQPSSENVPTLRRRLNPMFVEWLMGWPIGWTSLSQLGNATAPTDGRSHAPMTEAAGTTNDPASQPTIAQTAETLASTKRRRIPTGWTSLAPLDSGSPETALSRYRRRMRSALSLFGFSDDPAALQRRADQ